MKKQHLVLLVLFLVAFTFSACREIAVSTKVNKDGSFTRIITVTGDSTDLFKKNLPYPVDDSWLMELKHAAVDSALYVTYTKTYRDSESLNSEIKSDTGWRSRLDRKIEVKKSFGFFYSYLTYDEVIKTANPFNLLDFNDFLSPEELRWLNNEKLPATEADTAIMEKVEDKAMEFMGKTVTAELVQVLEKGINDLNDPDLNSQLIQMYYDSILKMVYEWEFDKPFVIIDKIAEWSGEDKILKLKENDTGLFREFDTKVAFLTKLIMMENYHQSVEMPGIITETNSPALIGNQANWDVQSFFFLYSDYKMHVESRVVNYWMFILTGIVVLLLLVLLLLKSYRQV